MQQHSAHTIFTVFDLFKCRWQIYLGWRRMGLFSFELDAQLFRIKCHRFGVPQNEGFDRDDMVVQTNNKQLVVQDVQA